LKVKYLVKNEQQSVTLYWLIRKITGLQQVKSTTFQDQKDLIGHRPINKYSKGESILMNPLLIYYVVQGVVKLSTFCDTGEEVLTGLVTSRMLFSSSITSLPIDQGTAITDVRLVCINTD
jgi:CRP-like cAMP-binding protein